MKRQQCCSVTKTCLTLCGPMKCSTPDFPVLHYLPGLIQVHVHWVSDAILPSHPLSSFPPPALSLSQHQGFFPISQLFTPIGQSIGASASALVPLVNIQEFISFRIHWLDLLAVQGILKSLLQDQNSKVCVLQCLALFMIELSHLYMTTGKTIALIRWTFVGKVTSLLFNNLSRLLAEEAEVE